jgi:hypothetical protein
MKFIKELTNEKNMGKEVKKYLNDYKVVVARSLNRIEDSYWEAEASDVGQLVPMHEDFETGNKTGIFWTDIIYDENLATSFSHSNTRQPLHTDGAYESNAPNIAFFYCLNPAKKGGATTCIDVVDVVRCLHDENPSLLESIQKNEVLFSKGNDHKRSKIIENFKCNWNFFRAEKCKLVEDFHAYLENRIVQMGILTNIFLTKGDAIFFNDELVLHGRNAFIGNRWLRKGGIRWSG